MTDQLDLLAPTPQRRGDFEEWWAVYPHRVGKAAARVAYQRASRKADKAVLIEGVRRYIAAKPPDRPWCNPSTWLNQERWLDQPAPSNGAAIGRSNGATDDHRLHNCAKLIAKGVLVASVKRSELRIMVERGWLSLDQAKRAGL